MKCPKCSTDLKRNLYEGLPVFHCGTCDGYLVATNRVEDINRRRETPTEVLVKEARTPDGADSEDPLRCPRCHLPMEKEFVDGPAPFRLDKCQICEFVWFDVGELARSQLDYESTTHAQEAARFQDRLHEMTPAERSQFEQNLARLTGSHPTLDVLSDAVSELAFRIRNE